MYLFQEISLRDINRIFQKALDTDLIQEARLLEGGLFNTSYYVSYGPHRQEAVLRLGPVNRQLLMGHEHGLMAAEAWICQTCAAQGLPCSQVLALDCSREVVDRDYMIAAYIPSSAMSETALTEPERESLFEQMGAYLRRLHQTEGSCFGYVSRILAGKGASRWSEALLLETEDILNRLETFQPVQQREALLELFHRSQALLDDAGVCRLLHTDLWEGNVLLDRESHKILAVIDGDRAVFGDPDFEFASSWMNHPALLRGYGMETNLSPQRWERRRLYQIYYCLLEGYVGFEKYGRPEEWERSRQRMEMLLIQDSSFF